MLFYDKCMIFYAFSAGTAGRPAQILRSVRCLTLQEEFLWR